MIEKHKHYLKDDKGLTLKQRITPHEFVTEYLKTRRNATQAVKNIQPNLTELSARNKGMRLLTNAHTQTLLNDIDDLITIGATKGVKRALQMVDSDNEDVATRNSWNLIEHARGKATQRVETQSTTVNLSLSLEDITHLTHKTNVVK